MSERREEAPYHLSRRRMATGDGFPGTGSAVDIIESDEGQRYYYVRRHRRRQQPRVSARDPQIRYR